MKYQNDEAIQQRTRAAPPKHHQNVEYVSNTKSSSFLIYTRSVASVGNSDSNVLVGASGGLKMELVQSDSKLTPSGSTKASGGGAILVSTGSKLVTVPSLYLF